MAHLEGLEYFLESTGLTLREVVSAVVSPAPSALAAGSAALPEERLRHTPVFTD
jgi:hypothetical protein